MTTEKLPCGHEIDPEILRYHMAFQRIKKANPGKIGSNLLAHFTCRQHTPPISYEYMPPSEGYWRERKPKAKKVPEAAPQ